MNRLRNKKGFTLLELLVTITIVALLAAFAVPAYLSYTERATFAKAMSYGDGILPYFNTCAQDQNGMASCGFGANGIPNYPTVTLPNGIAGITSGINPGEFTVNDDNGNSVTFTPQLQLDASSNVIAINWDIACSDSSLSPRCP